VHCSWQLIWSRWLSLVLQWGAIKTLQVHLSECLCDVAGVGVEGALQLAADLVAGTPPGGEPSALLEGVGFAGVTQDEARGGSSPGHTTLTTRAMLKEVHLGPGISLPLSHYCCCFCLGCLCGCPVLSCRGWSGLVELVVISGSQGGVHLMNVCSQLNPQIPCFLTASHLQSAALSRSDRRLGRNAHHSSPLPQHSSHGCKQRAAAAACRHSS